MRVASHPRSSAAYCHTINPEHRPKSHQAHLEWTPSRLLEWARTIGPATSELFARPQTAEFKQFISSEL